MGYSIHQIDPTTWQLRDGDKPVGTFEDGVGRTGYDLAVGVLAEMAATGTDGLLPQGFVSPSLALSEKLPGGRDFTTTQWSWRDPSASLVPMMFQTKNEGHDGADLVGFFTELGMDGTTVTGRGRFYDTEMGRQARDVLLDGRPFGVSVDPSEKLDVEIVEAFDGEMSAVFHAYEVAGATMHPFQGFDGAQVLLDEAPNEAVPMRASAPSGAPSRALMMRPEPPIDELTEQVDKAGNVLGMAYPLTITDVQDDGYRYAYAHLTYWGQCHTGNPWGPSMCASASPSETGYADFHAGEVACDDGTKIATGRLVVGCEHSDAMDVAGVRDHLAHAGMGWASAHVVDGEFGPWMCAVLDPTLTEQQIALLRSLSLSGEWVGELGGILAVNASGLPVQRSRLAASGFPPYIMRPGESAKTVHEGRDFEIPVAVLRASVTGGQLTKLVGANIVRACPECEQRRLAASADPMPAILADLVRTVRAIDVRTQHLKEPAAEAMIARLAASAKP